MHSLMELATLRQDVIGLVRYSLEIRGGVKAF